MNKRDRNRRWPHCSFAALMHFLDTQSGQTPLPRIDVALFGRGHHGVATSIIDSLAALDLIDPDGTPTHELAEMIATPEARKLHLRSALWRAYPTLEDLPIDGKDFSADQFAQHVRHRIANIHDRAAQFAIDTTRYLVLADATQSPGTKSGQG